MLVVVEELREQDHIDKKEGSALQSCLSRDVGTRAFELTHISSTLQTHNRCRLTLSLVALLCEGCTC